ncbi:MAG: IS630 family transposase [Solirubrobacteraceae bacterium]
MKGVADPTFAACFEDVLDVYARAFDPKRPLVCFDETGKELQAHTRPPLPPAPGLPAREDYEYERHGSSNLFLAVAPLLGWRKATPTTQRTRIEWAQAIKALVDEDFPGAEKIVLVQDNLNTHTPASLYAAFSPAEAKRIWDKLEFHYTPKHGSWLNMAELEISVLRRQCLDRRIPDAATLEREVQAWAGQRNAARATISWSLTKEIAREKLPWIYPNAQQDNS